MIPLGAGVGGPRATGVARTGLRSAAAHLSAVLTAAGLGCATPGVTQLQGDLDNIQQQLWKIQKDNVALVEQLTQLRDSQAGGRNTEAAPDLRLRLEALERDLQTLRARSEEAEQRLSGMVQDLRTTRQALDALARTLPAPGTGPSMASNVPAGDRPATGGAPEAVAPAAPGYGAPQDLFRQASANFTSGSYALAIQELTDLVRRYPASDVADDARYLIGEAYFNQQKYPEAISAFDQLLQSHAGGVRAAPAYLKKGLALLELNRTADAVIQLQHVVTAYPRSEEARIARERLRALGLKER